MTGNSSGRHKTSEETVIIFVCENEIEVNIEGKELGWTIFFYFCTEEKNQ